MGKPTVKNQTGGDSRVVRIDAPTPSGGSGDVVGPASSVDGDVVLFDGTTGKLIKVGTTTGSGSVVRATAPTLNIPAIANYSAATHDHSTNALGGQLHARYRTVTRVIYIESPAATDSFPLGFVETAATVTRVIGVTDVGTVDFNIEKRSKLTPDVAGTDIDSTDFQATAAGLEDTAFTAGSIGALEWLHYAASAVATAPTKLWVAMVYTID